MNKQEISAFLQANGIPFAVTERKAVCNMEELGDIALPYPEWDAVRDDKKREYYLITVIGDRRVDLKAFRRAHGLRPLSFATAEEIAKRCTSPSFPNSVTLRLGGCRRERCSAQTRACCTAHRPRKSRCCPQALPKRRPAGCRQNSLCVFFAALPFPTFSFSLYYHFSKSSFQKQYAL